VHGFCYSLGPSTPDSISQYYAGSGGPNVNDAQYDNPQLDSLFKQVRNTFDYNAQIPLMQQVHQIVTEEAPWLFIVHDLNARAFSSKVRGIVDPQSWSINLMNAWVAS
jgi:peptide/nickel transport system substrate-binding protein